MCEQFHADSFIHSSEKLVLWLAYESPTKTSDVRKATLSELHPYSLLFRYLVATRRRRHNHHHHG